MEQRKENQKRWDAARDTWQPGDPTDDIERFGRIDLDFKNRLAAEREGTPADPQQIASGLTVGEAQIPGSFEPRGCWLRGRARLAGGHRAPHPRLG